MLANNTANNVQNILLNNGAANAVYGDAYTKQARGSKSSDEGINHGDSDRRNLQPCEETIEEIKEKFAVN